MNYGCSGLNVIITGGTSGIGRACAEILASEGANVFVLARHKVVIKNCKFVKCDVTIEKSVEKAITQIVAIIGNKVDIVINSAGIYREQNLMDFTAQIYREIMDTNVLGTVLVCKNVLKYMKKGSIVNVASDAGVRGNYGCVLYSASKGAVVAFSRSLALDVAPNIRVNCVCPADVDTPLTRKQCDDGKYTLEECEAVYPLQKIGTAQEIAHVICGIASPANGFMTGSVVMVDGGLE